MDVPSCHQVGHTGNPCRSKLLTQWRLPCICTGTILWTALHPSSTILYLPTIWNSSLTTYTQQRQGNIMYIQSGWQVTMHGKCRCVFITCTLESWSYNKQLQIPHGATLIGTILSLDKMNISTLSGGHVAHPLFIGLANIKMSTRLKLSSHSLMLTALLPIPNFIHPNRCMHSVLRDWLVHQCLDIVLSLGKSMGNPWVLRAWPVPVPMLYPDPHNGSGLLHGYECVGLGYSVVCV